MGNLIFRNDMILPGEDVMMFYGCRTDVVADVAEVLKRNEIMVTAVIGI